MSGPALVRHLFDELGDLEDVAVFVFGQRVVAVGRHVHEGIQSDDVGGAEDRRFGAAHRLAEDLVDVLDGHLVLGHQLDDAHHAVYADSVGHEVGRVLAEDDALAEHVAAEFDHVFTTSWLVALAGTSSSSFM